MDIRVFKTFLEVAKTRHFGKAAENLFLTQAAVSARIKLLEQHYDTQLFQRQRNSIQLTSAGERLITYSNIIVDTLSQAKIELALSDQQKIQLALAGTPNIWDAYLQDSLHDITNTFKGYSFLTETISRELINRQLLERTLDIGVSFDVLKSEEIVSQRVATLELVLVSTKVCNVETAMTESYVYVDWGSRFAIEHQRQHPRMPPPIMRTSTGRIALRFILENEGAAYLPHSLVEFYIERGDLHLVEDAEQMERPVYLAYRKDSAALEAVERVVKVLDSEAEQV